MPRNRANKDDAAAPPKASTSRRKSTMDRQREPQTVAFARADDADRPVAGPSRRPRTPPSPIIYASPYEDLRAGAFPPLRPAASSALDEETRADPYGRGLRQFQFPAPPSSSNWVTANEHAPRLPPLRSIPQHAYPTYPPIRHPPPPPMYGRSPSDPTQSAGTSQAAQYHASSNYRRPGLEEYTSSPGRLSHPQSDDGQYYYPMRGPELAPLDARGPETVGSSRQGDAHPRLPPIKTLLYPNESPRAEPSQLSTRQRVSIPELTTGTGSTDSPLLPVTPASARPIQRRSSQKAPEKPAYRAHDPFAKKKPAEGALNTDADHQQWPGMTDQEGQDAASPGVSYTGKGKGIDREDVPAAPPRLPRNLPPIPWHRVEYDGEFLDLIHTVLNKTWARFRNPREPFPELVSYYGLRFQVLDILHFLYFPSRQTRAAHQPPVPQSQPRTLPGFMKPEPDMENDATLLHRAVSPTMPSPAAIASWLQTLIPVPARNTGSSTTDRNYRDLQFFRYNPLERRLPHELLAEPILMWCMDILIRTDLSDQVLLAIIVYLICLESAIEENLEQSKQTRAMHTRSPPLSSPQIAMVACCSLATKFEEEKPYSLKAWSRITMLALVDLLQCEQQVCRALQWNAWPMPLVKDVVQLRTRDTDESSPRLPQGPASAMLDRINRLSLVKQEQTF